MRSSTVALLGVFGVLAISGCSISTTPDGNGIIIKSKPEYVDNSQPAKTSVKDWNGEEITINNDGVNPLTGDGGIEITADPAATKITVRAQFAARADNEPDAQSSIRDAIGTLVIGEDSGKFAIACGHGQAHGTSDRAASGCKKLFVTIPAGSDAKPLKLTVGNGMGNIVFKSAVTVSALNVDNNGVGGTVDVKVIPVKGARIAVTGEDDVVVALPSNFAADLVKLAAQPDRLATDAENAARIVTTDFPGMKAGEAYGTVGTGAAELAVETKGDTATPVSLAETITIRKL